MYPYLNVQSVLKQLGNFRSEHRIKKYAFSDYYDDVSYKTVSKIFAWQIKHFNYKTI
jgi:hypothetical protein